MVRREGLGECTDGMRLVMRWVLGFVVVEVHFLGRASGIGRRVE